MKFRRQAKIIELIEKQVVETQEELTSLLLAEGFDTTQATISRDIKELRLVKLASQNGVLRYGVSSQKSDLTYSIRLQNIFAECVVKIDIAQNLVVIKTLPGLGSAAAAAIDSLPENEIIGTLAGDDTVFVAMKDVESAKSFAKSTRKMLN